MVTYEFTPPLIEVGGGPAVIYPGLGRETLAEFLFSVGIFLMGAAGLYLLREAPRHEEEAWSTYMYVGLFLFLFAAMLLTGVFMQKVGLLR